jgi:hypothetical protein
MERVANSTPTALGISIVPWHSEQDIGDRFSVASGELDLIVAQRSWFAVMRLGPGIYVSGQYVLVLFESRLNSFLQSVSNRDSIEVLPLRCAHLVNLLKRLDLPTPLSPMRTTLNKKSSCHQSASYARLFRRTTRSQPALA